MGATISSARTHALRVDSLLPPERPFGLFPTNRHQRQFGPVTGTIFSEFCGLQRKIDLCVRVMEGPDL